MLMHTRTLNVNKDVIANWIADHALSLGIWIMVVSMKLANLIRRRKV
jgi:hypothetical protein